MKINPKVPGYRFHSNVVSRKLESTTIKKLSLIDRIMVLFGFRARGDKSCKLFEKPKRICSVCGNGFDVGLQTGFNDDGTQWCRHDNACRGLGADPTKLTTAEERRISDKLKPNEFAVKQNDGTIAICERTK